MIVGTEVTSHEAPGAVGVVTRRIDSDDGVVCLVSWVTASGQTAITWHKADALTPDSHEDQDNSDNRPLD